MNTIINNNEKNTTHHMIGNGEKQFHEASPHRGGHKGPGKKWVKLLKNIVQSKLATAEEVHAMAVKA